MTAPQLNPQRSGPGLHLSFEAIGTKWRIDSDELLASAVALKLERAVARRIERFDRDYSRFRADSLVTAMAGRAGRYRLPADARPMLDLYRDLYQLSDGRLTPLIGQTLADAGYDAAYSLRPGRLTAPPSWAEVLDYHFPYLTLSRPALLDFGAAGKGYLVDLVAGLLADHGVTSYRIDAGGDLLHRGPRTISVGLEHPDDPAQAIGVAKLQDASLCGSAGSRRAWAGFHHIIDPRTLASPQHLKAVWVTAATTLLADGLATALYFVPAVGLAQHYRFDYALVKHDLSLEHSPGFPAEFY